MRITVIYAAGYAPDNAGLTAGLRDTAPTWGSWKTWRDCHTQNVICHDLVQASALHQRALQAVCNFYIPERFWLKMHRPSYMRFYQGDFDQAVDDIEDIIAMHLVAPESDLVLLLGFDLGPKPDPITASQTHRVKNRQGLIRSCLAAWNRVQWVLIDHPADLDPAFACLPNVTMDNIASVMNLMESSQ
jgi:hypothetical protein